MSHKKVPNPPVPRLSVLGHRALLRHADPGLRETAALLKAAAKVTIFSGSGCAQAQPEMLQAAEALGAPKSRQRLISV
ncbi:hypothetical protein EJV47_11205 [Hymenobacter gummosus]|uniref:Thiamine pyrophosphate enzyme central domain-containing protein n=1 Tax=Hymenobacter gummosus TaxID=1776032 RepID=A0A431U3X5_9BACT|nr:hypothetical protein [Hymenobacter gummosus]RTQ50194.1 hypothetical protein EJV47_11205 [Hymenobacter gummosus]